MYNVLVLFYLFWDHIVIGVCSCCCGWPAYCLNVCIYVCNMYIKWRRQAFQTGGRGHFIRWKIVGGGGQAKKQATKKRYHFITLRTYLSHWERGCGKAGNCCTLNNNIVYYRTRVRRVFLCNHISFRFGLSAALYFKNIF